MSSKPRMMLYGDFYPGRLARSYERAFKQHKVDVVRFDTSGLNPTLDWYLRNRISARLLRRCYRARKFGARRWNRKLIRRVREIDVDLLFVLKGRYLFPETIREIQELGTTVFIFHPDSPLKGTSNYRPEFVEAGLRADAYFIWSETLKEKLEEKGIDPVFYLPFGWDSEVFPNYDFKNEKFEVTFIGNESSKRRGYLGELARHVDLKIWGGDRWRRKTLPWSPIRQAWQGHQLPPVEATEVIAQSKINLNILREQNLPDGTNMRTFELPGAGGFFLSNWSGGAAKIYPPEQMGDYFKTPTELVDKVSYYLECPQKRAQMAASAHRRTVRAEKYRDRAKFVLKCYRQY